MDPKDRLEPKEVFDPVYKIMCGGGGGEECNETYIGETERSLKVRFLEHRRPSSTLSEVSRHINNDKPERDVHIDETRFWTDIQTGFREEFGRKFTSEPTSQP